MNDSRHGDAGCGCDDERVEELFHEALAHDASERAAFLERETRGDAALLREVRELLAALGEAPSCMERPLWGLGERLDADAREADVVGSRVGPYVIKGLLGEGGMGEVYLAEQTEPLRREVALKRIKLGMDTHEVVRRFESERLALARLNHPNIAAVHDAGVTPAGRPYFVMEYVPGERITEYCDRRHLGLADRLAIFVQVCEAVQHAHQKGIIHRDLKPGNVLVKTDDGRAVPKVIDFGVAKATAGTDTERTAFTRNGQILGTPGYMSPEQAVAGHDVDTRTDVYSLGVLLYELVTGVLPFDVESWRTLGADEMRRVLSQDEAPRPSVRLGALGVRARVLAARRRSDPKDLLQRLRGDIDWIALRALERDPARRYGSASELALDLLRHLEGEPVSAGPPSLLRRAARFATLHRREALAGAAAVVLATSGAFVFALFVTAQNRQLERQLVDAEVPLMPRGARGDVEPLVPPGERTRAPDERPYASVRVRNGGLDALSAGDLVSYAGLVSDGRFGMLPEVLRAERDAGAVFLGVVAGALEARGSGDELVPGDVPPGGLASVAVQGTLVPVRLEGPVRARDPLGLSSRPGLATRHSGDGPVVGLAMESSRGDGPATVLAIVAPSWPQVVSAEARSSWMSGFAAREASTTREPAVAPAITFLVSSSDDGTPPDPWPNGWTGKADPSPEPAGPTGPSGNGKLPSGSIGDGGDGGGDAGDGPDPDFPIHGGELGGSGALTLGGAKFHEPVPLLSTLPDAPGSGEGVETGGKLGGNGKTPGLANGGLPDEGLGAGEGDSTGDDATGDDGHGAEKSGLETVDLAGGGQDVVLAVREHWGDYDGDGLTDLLLDVEGEAPRLLHNQGQGEFEDVTPWLSLDVPAALGSAQWIDFDHDGHLDLIGLVSVTGRLVLQRGDGRGGFTDATLVAGLARLPAGAALQSLDVDGDQHVDLRLLTRRGGLLLLLDTGAAGFRVVVLRAEPEPTDGDDADGADGSTTSDGVATGAGSGKPKVGGKP